jgi:thiaminase
VFAILTKKAKIRPYQAWYDRWKSEQETQAVRTAWRIVKDWVEAQMARVETRIVTTAKSSCLMPV